MTIDLITFESVEDAIKELKLDRRVKWDEYNGCLGRSVWYTEHCWACSEYSDTGQHMYSAGCRECGFTGRRRREFHEPYMHEGKFVAIKTVNSPL
jgi:hypothetical protein